MVGSAGGHESEHHASFRKRIQPERRFWRLQSSQRAMLKQSEAIVLRSYPLREADLLVTLFTRAEGKLRGVAKAAKRSKKRFGGALEPLTYVRLYYDDRE